MFSYVIRRLLLAVPTLIGMTAVVFFIMALSPGGTAADLIAKGEGMKPQEREAIRAYLNKRYGLDDPVYKQYFRWLNQISPFGFHTQSDREVLQDEWARERVRAKRDNDAALVTRIADATKLPRERVEQWLAGKSQLSDEQWKSALAVAGESDHNVPSYRWPVFKAPDLGMSMVRSRKVSELILDALPVTLMLNLITLPLIYSLSIIIGIQAAKRRGQFLDVGTGTVLLGMWSFPVILAGLLLQGYLANKDKLGWFPVAELHSQEASAMTYLPSRGPDGWSAGYFVDTLWHLVLPVICLAYGGFAFLSKLSRGAVLENIMADYARTARAKGVSERGVLYRHVFRNSLIPLITFAATLLPSLIAGAIVVESIFSLRGMGWLIVDSTFLKDREVVLAEAVIAGALTLVSYLLADILYAVADPRVTFD
jgi:peptide/nickel transport system permease protein